MKILHLSDLHITEKDISQDIVLDSLQRKIKSLAKNGELQPDVLIITGDIAFSGRTEEYSRAIEYVKSIVEACKVNPLNVLVIPGNHDIDRSKISRDHLRWWYDFSNEEQVTGNLSSDISYPHLVNKSKAYNEFAKRCMNAVNLGKFGEYIHTISQDNDTIKIIGVNSTLFCGYDKDDEQRLALGLEQITSCQKEIPNDEAITISCIHHPFTCFHQCDRTSLNVLQQISDIILSGHVHESTNSTTIIDNNRQTTFISAGSCYEKRKSENSFNVIDLDLQLKNGTVRTYKYLPLDNSWIVDKNRNQENDGLYCFKIPKTGKPEITGINASAQLQKYVALLNIEYTDLNRERVAKLLLQLKNLTGDNGLRLIRIERGSVKIYFETSADLDQNDSSRREVPSEITEIRKAPLSSGSEDSSRPDKSIYHWRTFLKPEFFHSLNDPGASFTHSRVDNLELKDLYVSPNLRRRGDKSAEFVNAENVLQKYIGKPLKILLYGADNSGKTTLIKWWFDKYYAQGCIPIIISGSKLKDISIESIKKLVEKQFNKQYAETFDQKLDEFDPDRLILIIDDFHRIRFSKSKFRTNLLVNLHKNYQNLLITGNAIMEFETFNSETGVPLSILDDFDKFLILEFGPKLRYELIQKWNGLGVGLTDPNDLIRLNNETEQSVESIIGKNFVPSYPVYLLTILQARELTNVTQKPEYSLHGFYYEILIYESLNKAVSIRADISLFFNFITDYCYFLFESKIRFDPIHINDFIKFHLKYCQEYKIKVPPNYVLETLVKSKLLKVSADDMVSISYKYVYYFFVARYLSNNIANDDIKDIIKALCERVHRDEFGSILMFLTHLSKDQFIVAQLLESSRNIFIDYKPIELEDDVQFINKMINELPSQIYLALDVDEIKKEQLKEEEILSIQEREFEPSKDAVEYDIDEDVSALDTLSKIIKAVKTIEIVGQLTKKYWGELKAQQKFELTEETYFLGLRILGFIYSEIRQEPELLVEHLKYIYLKRNQKNQLTKEQIEKASRHFLFDLCTRASFSVTKRITHSIGYEKLAGTFEDVLKVHPSTSVKLIDTSIKLDYHKSFPWKEIEALKEGTGKHYLADSVLRQLAINYLYMFNTSIEDKQRLCTMLGIDMDLQRMIEQTSTVKRESK